MSKYRYRPIHSAFELVVRGLAALLPRPKSMEAGQSVRRVLVIKFGGMGEAILARSIVEHLRLRKPELVFDFLVEGRTLETMTCGGAGASFLYQPSSDGIGVALKVLRQIRARKYDAVLDFEQRSLLTAAFMWATAIPIRVGFVPPIRDPRGKLFTHPIQLREGQSMWSAFLRLGKVLDPELRADLSTLPLPLSKDALRWFEDWRRARISKDGPVVAFHLGVGPSAQYRRWPVESFVELAEGMLAANPNLTIVLTGSKSEQSLVDSFVSHFSGQAVEASDLGGLERTAALLHDCDLLVSGDTGIMHIGAAMGAPTVGLFGPNTPDCWGPVGPHATWVFAHRQPCSPCINSYRREIPAECTAAVHGACMKDISVDDVLRAARTVIQGDWLPVKGVRSTVASLPMYPA